MLACGVLLRNTRRSVWASKAFLCSTTETPDIREKLLSKALEYVKEHGWNEVCLSMAAKDLNLPPLAHRIVEKGAADLVCAFLDRKHMHVSKEMDKRRTERQQQQQNTATISSSMIEAIELHLGYIHPYKHTLPEAMAICMEPLCLSYTLPLIFRTADDLCYFADIHTSQSDWYTERLLAAALHTSTELYYLTDSSPDFQDTRCAPLLVVFISLRVSSLICAYHDSIGHFYGGMLIIT
ncbi:COQ9 family protein [archaeon]|nr:MAG: COQ9 family protein [archaeon]